MTADVSGREEKGCVVTIQGIIISRFFRLHNVFFMGV